MAYVVSLDVHPVLDELIEHRRSGDAMNAATMSLLVFVEDPSVAQWARDRTRALANKHPARVIVLDATQDEGKQSADWSVTRGEWVELGIRGSDSDRLASAISVLAIPDAPAILLWVAAGIGTDERLATLAHGTQSVIYNSSLLDLGDASLRELIAFATAHPEVALHDISYLRLLPWQECIAAHFDDPGMLEELPHLCEVSVASGSDAEAFYALGWLASRLGWSPRSADAFATRFGTEVSYRIERAGGPRRVRRIAVSSPRARFAAIAESDTAEAILFEVDGEKSRARRCGPLTGIDIASLIERAILHNRHDRIFRESLGAAADIIGYREARA